MVNISTLFSRFFRLQRSRQVAATSSKPALDDPADPPPPYLEKSTLANLHREGKLDQQEEDLVYRLRCCIIRSLVARYNTQGDLGGFNNDTTYHEHYLDLCKKYCMLLGMQFGTRRQVVATKQELLKEIFEPARVLGIPADVMEYLLFFTRWAANHFPDKHEFDGPKNSHPLAMLLVMAIDYTIMIDAVVEAHWPSLACKLKDRCLALHNLCYPWMLDLRLITLDRKFEAHHDTYRHPGCPIKSSHKKPSTAHKHQSLLSQSANGALSQDTRSPHPCTQFADMHLSCTNFSSDFPSFLLPYRLQTSWPLVAFVSVQSRRPCVALASPATSQSLYVSQSDFTLWMQKVRKDPKTTFQPRCKRVAQVGFTCGLPNTIKVVTLKFTNPEGGVPKSVVVEDGDGNDWEAQYVRDHLPARDSASRPIEQPLAPDKPTDHPVPQTYREDMSSLRLYDLASYTDEESLVRNHTTPISSIFSLYLWLSFLADIFCIIVLVLLFSGHHILHHVLQPIARVRDPPLSAWSMCQPGS